MNQPSPHTDKIVAELMALARAHDWESLEQAIRRAGLGTFIDGFAACKASGGRGAKIKPSQKSMRELLSEAALGDSQPVAQTMTTDTVRMLPPTPMGSISAAWCGCYSRTDGIGNGGEYKCPAHALPQRAEPASVQAAEALRAGVEALEHGRGYPSYDRALASIEAAIARLNAVQPASIALQELRDEWSRARAVDGTKHHECMHMVQVGDRMIRALAALAQRQPAPADPQAPSQEAARCSDGGECGAGGYCEACPARASQEAREYPPPKPGWNPIETAPKEAEVLVWFGPSVGVKSALYTELHGHGIWYWCVDDEKFDPHPVRRYCPPYPTHWMPLPSAPAVHLDLCASQEEAAAAYQAAATKLRGEFHGEDGYPPMPEPAMEEVPYELWGQNSTYPALYTDEQMRSYVDSDRKARQQEALDARRWRTFASNYTKEGFAAVTAVVDAQIAADDAALAKGPSHE